MCNLLGMRKLQTTPYHLQMNGLVERSHQTIMQMTEKLREDKKADWPGHLAEIVHVLQCHLICCDRVQSTLFNVWMQAKANS